jgi:hypothetical protein
MVTRDGTVTLEVKRKELDVAKLVQQILEMKR